MIQRWIGLFLSTGLVFVMVVLFASPSEGMTQTGNLVYMPIVGKCCAPDFLIPSEPLPAPQALSHPAPDFSAIRQSLASQGLNLGFNKIGFHTGTAGNARGLGDWMVDLDSRGIPFFLKSVDDAGAIYEAQQLMQASGVPHTLVFRRTGNDYDVPDYNLPPDVAAVVHWDKHIAVFPPELDKSLVWLETINEVDKNRSEWLAQFALKTAELALRDGYKWAAFGWSSGEPEPEHWSSPYMLEFLRLAAKNPDRIAIALHEYSYDRGEIGRWYPYLLGRFQQLFQICDNHQIERPTILITEWGWEYQNIPDVSAAMEDIAWASRLYAAYPQVKGAAIWYLGGYYGDIHNQTQRLIEPMSAYSRTNYFGVTPGKGRIDSSLFPPNGTRAQSDVWPLFESTSVRQQFLEPLISTPR